MTLQRLMSLVRKAVDEYNLIEENDKIAVGVSGGKDSLALLYAMKGLQRFYPKHFELIAVSVDLGFEGFDLSPIAALCKELSVPFEVIHTDIGQIIFTERKEKNPCSLCAKMRKGALYTTVKELGCNKVAYAHHRDDIVETTMMSLIYEGHFYCFPPKTYLDRMGVTVIRPMIYVPEADVIGFKNKYHLPVVKNPCPADGFTKREYIKNLVRQINHENPGAKDRMFTAVINGTIPAWTSQEKNRSGKATINDEKRKEAGES